MRINAIDRMRRALDEYYITGIKTTVPFHAAMMRDGDFRDGNYDTGLIDRLMSAGKLTLKSRPLRLHQSTNQGTTASKPSMEKTHRLGSRRSLRLMRPLHDCRLYGIIDLGYVERGDAAHIVEQMIEGGVDVIQLRGKNKSIGELADLAAELHELAA